MYSDLSYYSSSVTAGQTNVFKIQAKDLQSNVVTETNEMFEFEITEVSTGNITNATISYEFGLYNAQFAL